MPDLRSASHIDKLQWWQKTCRNECIVLDVYCLEFKTTTSPLQTVDFYEIRFKEAEGELNRPFLCQHINYDCLLQMSVWPFVS